MNPKRGSKKKKSHKLQMKHTTKETKAAEKKSKLTRMFTFSVTLQMKIVSSKSQYLVPNHNQTPETHKSINLILCWYV